MERLIGGFLLVLTIAAFWGVAVGSFNEEFGPGWEKRWYHSSDSEYTGKLVVEEVADSEDPALKVPKEASRYGLTALLDKPVEFSGGVILQYEVKWASMHTCGGGYLKFFTHDPVFKAVDMHAATPYSVMFGPDKCGQTNKVHFIMRHQNPLNGEYEEKHLTSAPEVPSGQLTHVYTAVIKADNTFEMLLDGKNVREGSLFEILSPSINPPEEIPDPSDVKPDDWVDDPEIPDPDATKPDDWVDEELIVDETAEKPSGWLEDEPKEIEDPGAVMPEDWDTEEDGEWVRPVIQNPKCKAAPGCGEWSPPMIDNPEYKGEWVQPMMENPDYKGPWVQRKMANPDYFNDEEPLENIGDIGAVGLEIWTMDNNIFFDNIVVTKSPEVAEAYREKWRAKNELEKEAEARKKESQAQQGSIGESVQNIIDHPSLESIQQYLQPIANFAKTNEIGFVGGIAGLSVALLFMLIMLCCRCCSGGRSKDADVGTAKKKDETGPDDEVTEGADKEESESKEEDSKEEISEEPRVKRRTQRAE